MSSSCCNNRRRQSNKCCCNFCKRFGHSFESCYLRNKSTVSISTTTVTNTESGQPMAPVSAQSQSSGSTFTISKDDLINIITNVICMVGNASYFSSLLALSGMSPTSWLMDSACCNHMIPHSSLFSELKPAPNPLNIRTANGSTMSGHNIGSVSTSNLSVPRVFNVPDLSYNLFWVYCARSKDGTRAWDRSQSWAYVSRGQLSSSTCCSCCYSCYNFLCSFPCSLAYSSWSRIFLSGTTIGF